MDEEVLVDLATVERVIERVRSRYRFKLLEAERRNDLILGELRRVHAENAELRDRVPSTT